MTEHIIKKVLNNELKKYFSRLKKGKVLDIGAGDSPYKKFIAHTEYLTLDLKNADIECDFHKIKWKPDYFDIVIATEILEHAKNPEKVINEIYRVLKKGGVCVLSTRFLFHYHPHPEDYYRFTKDSLEDLFKKFSKTEIESHGNKFLVLWQILNTGRIGKLLNTFNPLIAKINYKSERFPMGFIVYAEK